MVRKHLSKASYKRALTRMRNRPVRARRMDRRYTKNVTTNLSKWLKRPARYDIRGIDTRRKKPKRRVTRRK